MTLSVALSGTVNEDLEGSGRDLTRHFLSICMKRRRRITRWRLNTVNRRKLDKKSVKFPSLAAVPTHIPRIHPILSLTASAVSVDVPLSLTCLSACL
jgi:hypothetical protein